METKLGFVMKKMEDENINDVKKVEKILSKDKATEEEFQNFMHRVTHVENIVKKLSSCKVEEQEVGKLLAEEFLKSKTDIDEDEELRVKSSRTVINKCVKNEDRNPNEMSKEVFMKIVEKDAKERQEDRKARNERAETYKKIGNKAFAEENYEKAVTYFGKALEQRKDSALLWNNRALSYMKLQLYERALNDFEWALKVNDANLKALINSAKCHKLLKNEDKYEEFIKLAKEKNPEYLSFIKEYEDNLCTTSEEISP